MSTVTETVDSGLTAQDRCDRCGAQAYASAMFESGFALLFCAHHYRKHKDSIAESAVAVTDGTQVLDAKPTPLADAE